MATMNHAGKIELCQLLESFLECQDSTLISFSRKPLQFQGIQLTQFRGTGLILRATAFEGRLRF